MNKKINGDQIDYQVQQGATEKIIHDVTSVKYNKENEMFSHQMTCVAEIK